MTLYLSRYPRHRFVGKDALPLADGQLYIYDSGTSTPAVVYSDSTGETQHDHPIVLDDRGEAPIYLPEGTYKFILKSETGVTIWSVDGLRGAAVSPLSYAPPTLCNDYYTFFTKLQFSGDGTIADESPSAWPLASTGDAVISSAQSVFGGESIYFDSAGTAISIADNKDIEVSLYEWTVSMWVYPLSLSGTRTLFCKRNNTATRGPLLIQLSGSTLQLYVAISSGSYIAQITSGGTLTVNQWNHVVCQRSIANSRIETWLNGTMTNTAALGAASSLRDIPDAYFLGGDNAGSNRFYGYIDDFNFTIGVALHDSTFTPSDDPFPVTQCDFGPIVMAAINGDITEADATLIGNASTSMESGSSAFIFPDSTSYAYHADPIDWGPTTDNFTFEMWFAPDGLDPGTGLLFELYQAAGVEALSRVAITISGDDLSIGIGNRDTLSLNWDSQTLSGSSGPVSITANRRTAHHIAVSYTGGTIGNADSTIRLFFDGTKVYETTSMRTLSALGNYSMRVGASAVGSAQTIGARGYIGPYALTFNTAKYSGDFTP